MPSVTAVVVGAGHCGLAMSRHLAGRSVDHVVLERGEVANSWRTQRWDSLRLLTPNWMTRLPGWEYQGDDPDGYLSAPEVADLIAGYAAASAAPVVTGTTVTSLRPGGEGFEVDTDQGRWNARTVIVAAGTTRGNVPAVARRLPDLVSIPALEYRNPDQLPDGGVLVVGASASGVQIADELQRAGRHVTLAVGEHVRVPRTYRGRDILWWLDALGILDERWDEVDDIVRARHLPSLQLVGASRTLDLNALQAAGVRLVGRFAGVREDVAQFSGSLANVCALADLKLGRLLDAIDDAGRGSRGTPRTHSREQADPRALPALGRDPLGGVGHRLPPRLLVARRTRLRPPRPAPARRRRDPVARPLRPGPADAAPASFDLHRRCPQRRGRPGPPSHRRPQGGIVNNHPLASSVATAVADRALDRLGTHLTDEIRLRALLPGGSIEEHGRDAVLARFDDWFGSYDTIVLSDVAGDDVGDRVFVHYKLTFDPDGNARVLTQSVVCSLRDGLVGRMDLVCSGFRELT